MDHSRIDSLTRFVARRTGRRSLAAGTLAGLLGSLLPGLRPTEAARKKRRKPRCKKPKRQCGKQCVNVKTNRQHCGMCNRRCKATHACRRGKCTPRPCGKGGPCRVFFTSSLHVGNLGGLGGADAICTRAAREAGLPGTYKAWVSNQFGSPVSRFTRNSGPYVLVNGARIANSWSDLVDGELMAPINIMENGLPTAIVPFVWTSTSSSGTWLGSLDCNSWTTSSGDSPGIVGFSEQSDAGWTYVGSGPCSLPTRLYCFQQS